ncbi:hypothetical protein ACFQ9X_24555 [Catenulispora yoronensis]
MKKNTRSRRLSAAALTAAGVAAGLLTLAPRHTPPVRSADRSPRAR